MSFSIRKGAVYGVALFAGLLAGILIAGSARFEAALIGAALGGVLGGFALGYLMRESALDVAAATPASVEAAIRSSWTLRGLKSQSGEDGVITYTRGAGAFGDVVTVTPTATGVTLRGPANLLAAIKKKAAG